MDKVLHILASEPDETVAGLIDAFGGDQGAVVVTLYPDAISGVPADWPRLVDDIFTHDKIICWW